MAIRPQKKLSAQPAKNSTQTPLAAQQTSEKKSKIDSKKLLKMIPFLIALGSSLLALNNIGQLFSSQVAIESTMRYLVVAFLALILYKATMSVDTWIGLVVAGMVALGTLIFIHKTPENIINMASANHAPARTLEKLIEIPATPGPFSTGLTVRKGDRISYQNPTVPFRVYGKAQEYYVISKTTEHQITSGTDDLVLLSNGETGYVHIKITPR